jgi:hypothetical protein
MEMSHRVFDFDVELFDATSLSGTENLEDVVDDIAVHVQDNPSVDVASYIQHTFDLNNSGQLSSINSTSIEIDVGLSVNGKNGDIAEIVTVTQDSEGGRGAEAGESGRNDNCLHGSFGHRIKWAISFEFNGEHFLGLTTIHNSHWPCSVPSDLLLLWIFSLQPVSVQLMPNLPSTDV